jgi:hypothetical protein
MRGNPWFSSFAGIENFVHYYAHMLFIAMPPVPTLNAQQPCLSDRRGAIFNALASRRTLPFLIVTQ